MATVNLSSDLVKEAKYYAEVSMRSVSKQLEHWVKVGKLIEANPNLKFSLACEALLLLECIEDEKDLAPIYNFGMSNGESYSNKTLQ